MRDKIFKFLLPIIGIILFFIFIKDCGDKQKEQQEKKNLIETLNDSLTYYKNEKGNLVAKISVFEAQNKENFLNLKTKDKEVVALQELLKKEKAKVATIIKTQTNIKRNFNYRTIVTDSASSTINLSVSNEDKYHKIKISTTAPLNDKIGMHFRNEKNEMVRKYYYNGEWEYEIQIKDSISIIHKKDSLGRMYVEVENKNPYSIPNSVRSYYETQPIEKQKSKKFSIGPNLSYGVNHKGEFLPYIGIGIQYNLIRF